MLLSLQTDALLRLALEEDLGTGDRTTDATIDAHAHSVGRLVAKQHLVVAGMPWFARVFKLLDSDVVVEAQVEEGASVAPGTVLATLAGRTRAILAGERTALNVLQRLCGTATEARRYAQALEGTGTRVTDTRKTTPGMRVMQKYAAELGGAANHRFGLDGGILIKDNHIAACGSVREAVARARQHCPHVLRIEVEVVDLDGVDQALEAGAHVILLDNMSTEQMAEAVRRVRASGERVLVEASGNMTFERLPEVAATGVDYISVGALTHSAPAADISLEITS